MTRKSMLGWKPVGVRSVAGVAAVVGVFACCGCAKHRAVSESGESAAAFAAGKPALPIAIIKGVEQPVPDIAMGDPATVRRILAEGKYNNHVMDHLTHICTKIGPRLTGSANAEKANRWAMEQFSKWGLTNAELFKWGEIPLRFDRGPSSGRIVVKREKKEEGSTEPKIEYEKLRDLELTTLAWSGGTNGAVRGPVVRMPETDEEFEQSKEQLKGAWVLLKGSPITGRQGLRVIGGSMSDRTLARYAIQTGKSLKDLGVDEEDKDRMANMQSLVDEQKRVLEAGAAGFISSSRDERVWTGAFRRWRELDPTQPPRDVEVSVRLSDYDYLNSRLSDGEKIEAEFDLQNTFTAGPIPVYDTVAEIRGTEKPDEYVIVSAHLDSWNGPGSMGTTDNGTGSSVTLEAAAC